MPVKEILKGKKKMLKTDFTIGCDPELFLQEKGSNKLISAIPIIKGTKENPQKLKRGMVSHDNVMIEYGTEPVSNENDWIDVNRSVLKEIKSILPENLKMIVRASANFDPDQLDNEEARIFGCDPDFDPYEFEMNEMPEDAPFKPLRTCGGHIHIGSKPVSEDIELIANLAKAYDVFLACPLMILSKDPSAVKRRTLYGKAGAHRPKDYGVEYRAIDSYWVSSPELTRLVFRLSRDGLYAVLNGHFEGIDKKKINEVLTKNDVVAAEKILKEFVWRLSRPDTRSLFNHLRDADLEPDLYKSWNI